MADDFRTLVLDTGLALTDEQQGRLITLFGKGAARVYAKPCHWIFSRDDQADGADYCPACVKKRIAELKKRNPAGEYDIDGGWRTDHDSLPACETCGAALDGALTEEGCEQEVEHFLEYGFDPTSDHDCYAMDEVINARGWQFHCGSERPPSSGERQYFWDLGRLCQSILAQLDGPSAPDAR